MEFYKQLLFNSSKELILVSKPQYVLKSQYILKENSTLFPRFNIKDADIFPDFPANKDLQYKPEYLLKAIAYGMVLQIKYNGEEDTVGHERFIYPLVYGKSKDGQQILRVYHLKGWSVSKGGYVEKVWRLFRCDKIEWIRFTGMFFRLAPDGYKMDDKQITQKLGVADFNIIRNNQTQLLDKNKVDTLDKTILKKVNLIEVKDLNFNLKLFDPWQNNILPKKDAKNIRITFAKSVIGNNWVAIVGVSIEPTVTFKMKVDNETKQYRSFKWIMADELDRLSTLQQQVEFKLYLFLKGQF